MKRPLTTYETMVLYFMDSREYTRGHRVALETAETMEEFDDAAHRMVERYDDWATD